MFDGVEVDVGLLVGVMEGVNVAVGVRDGVKVRVGVLDGVTVGVKVVTAHAGTESSRPVGAIVLRFSS